MKDLLACIESQLIMLEDVVADVTRSAHEQLDALRVLYNIFKISQHLNKINFSLTLF